MWIFLNNSYLSIVRHRDFSNHLLVRARNKGDIEIVFPKTSVEITPNSDYLFRAVIHESLFADRIKKAICNIDYDNFKNSIIDETYHTACMGVWSTMYAYQEVGTGHAEKKKD